MIKVRHPYLENKISFLSVLQVYQYVKYSQRNRAPISVPCRWKWLVQISRREHTCARRLVWMLPYSTRCEMLGALPICTYYISMDRKLSVLSTDIMFEYIKWDFNANIWDFLMRTWNIFAIMISKLRCLSVVFQNK